MTRARDVANLGNNTTNLETLDTLYGDNILTGRNLIINGAMVIDQRNATTTANGSYTLDRWKVFKPAGAFSVVQDTEAPDGFQYSMKISNTTTGTPTSAQGGDYWTVVEGYNAAHLQWGTSNAKDVTLTFWVRSNKIGTYCLVVAHTGFSASSTHSYVSEYTINTADTWEQKTIHIDGPTVGTWNTTTGHGVALGWSLGQGTNFNTSTTDAWISGNKRRTTNQVEWQTLSSANMYVTGVQLEVGDTATPFEHQSFGDELRRCQRYFYKFDTGDGTNLHAASYAANSWVGDCYFPVTMRATPTISNTTGSYTTAASGIGKRKFYVYKNTNAVYISTFDADAEL